MDSNTIVVFFQIDGLGIDEIERANLLEFLLSDEEIIGGRMFTYKDSTTRCQLYVPKSISPEYVRALLNAKGYDYDFSSVSFNGVLKKSKHTQLYSSKKYLPLDGFPSGNILTEKEYNKEKDMWISNHRGKYKKVKKEGTATYPIIISHDQFNSFTELKQERILSQPDVFIVE